MPSHDSTPSIGQHMATLNLFREADGTFWLTVADAPGAVIAAQTDPRCRSAPDILAGWVGEARERFVESWTGWRRG